MPAASSQQQPDESDSGRAIAPPLRGAPRVFHDTAPGGTERAECLTFFRTYGFAVLGAALDKGEVKHLNNWYDASQQRYPEQWGTERGPSVEKMFHQPLLYYTELDGYVRHSGHYSLVAELLGGEEHARFSEFDFRETPAGTGGGFHQDGGHARASDAEAILARRGQPHMDYICSMHYLTDVSERSPAFSVIPQTHRFAPDPAGPDAMEQLESYLGDSFERLPLYGPAGTAAIYDISLFHSRWDATAGAETRRAWQTYYSRGDVPALTDWVVVPRRLAESDDPDTLRFYSLQSGTEKMAWFREREYSTAGLAPEERTTLRLWYGERDVR